MFKKNYLQDEIKLFCYLQELRSLECRSCGLSKIDGLVYQLLPNLQHLDLGDNELSSITSDEFKPLTALKHLKLDGNRLTTLKSSVFFNQKELQILNLARNEISKISRDVFDNLNRLYEIDLSKNRFENSPPDLISISSLKVLVFNQNQLSLENLEKLLTGLKIEQLHLSECDLVDIPYPLFPDTLKILNLASNHLITLTYDVVPQNLDEIDLSGNRFRGLDEDLLNKLEDVKILKLERNPWSCDLCHIIPLLTRVNRSTNFKEIKCHQPYSLKGKKLSNIKRNELTWCPVPGYTSSDANFFLLGDDGRIGLIAAGSSVCLLFLVVVGIIGAILYSRRHAAKYYTHEDKLTMEGDSVFENHSPLFCDDRELSFKFPLDAKMGVCTIENEMKKEQVVTTNGG